MATFVCTQVNTTTLTCEAWAEQVGMLPPLSAEQGIEVGSLVFLSMATAWGFRILGRFISNRR